MVMMFTPLICAILSLSLPSLLPFPPSLPPSLYILRLLAAGSGKHVPNPDEMETLPWPGLPMPAIRAPACLGAITNELVEVASTCQFDPRNQHKAKFKSLLQQKKDQDSGSAPARIGRSS